MSNIPKKVFDCEAKLLQQGVHDAFFDATGGVQKSFYIVPEAVGRSLSLLVGHSKRDESAMLGSWSAHSTYRE